MVSHMHAMIYDVSFELQMNNLVINSCKLLVRVMVIQSSSHRGHYSNSIGSQMYT
jgi:hypothetical protein